MKMKKLDAMVKALRDEYYYKTTDKSDLSVEAIKLIIAYINRKGDITLPEYSGKGYIHEIRVDEHNMLVHVSQDEDGIWYGPDFCALQELIPYERELRGILLLGNQYLREEEFYS